MIIHLNGMGGVGKLTVAKLLANEINAHLVDNHSLIDTVTTCCNRGSPEYFVMLKKVIDLVLEQIEIKPKDVFIFTNALSSEYAEDRERLDYLKNFSQDKGIAFLQVLLFCDLEENKKRIISEDRKSKGKLTNPDALDEIYQNYTIYHPTVQHSLSIDTTHLSPEKVSFQIKNYLKNIILDQL